MSADVTDDGQMMVTAEEGERFVRLWHVHADGTVHGGTHGEGESALHAHALPLAVVLHRIPVAIAIWWLLKPRQGTKAALLTMALIAIGSVLGFALAAALARRRRR